MHGRVNLMTAEEAQHKPNMILGMFPVETNLAIVLFDSGATHSFISASFITRHNLRVTMMKDLLVISSPGGEMKTRRVCPKVNLNIRGVEFLSNLIVLGSKGINIILGMDWLTRHKGVIHYATKSIQLTYPDSRRWYTSQLMR